MSDHRIVDCAAVKSPDESTLFVVKTFLVLEDGVKPTIELKAEILQKLKGPITLNGKIEQLKEYEIPTDIIFVDALPRISGTEKVDYRALEVQAAQV